MAEIKQTATYGIWKVNRYDDNGMQVFKNGELCPKSSPALREIAAEIGLEVNPDWRTSQLGANVVKAMLAIGGTPAATPQPTNPAPVVDNSAQEAAAQAKAEAEKAKAELERAKAKAEAEAEAAKAELARIKAEAAKAQAEAEAARKAAAKAQADAAKAEKEAAAPAPAAPAASKTSSNKGALNGMFSVAANKKVRFSMGNLQFNPKKYEWRFAEKQWDVIGEDNAKIARDYDGWIDLFGYGTSGYMGCEPTDVSQADSQYPQQDINDTNYDWGVYNPILNGGNKEGIWRTLKKDEWLYIIKGRQNSQKLHAKACVNGINGVILLPDDFYEHRVRIPFDSTPSGFSENTYDLTQWNTLEKEGAVFLPCAGIRSGSQLINTYNCNLQIALRYWTSSKCGPQQYIKNGFDAYSIELFLGNSMEKMNSNVSYGMSVRLVQDVK